MTYLAMIEYEDMVRELDQHALDPWLKTREPIWTNQGAYYRPDSVSGGLSIVFKVKLKNTAAGAKTKAARNTREQKNALRFWVTSPGKVAERFPHVASYLRQHPLPYFVDYNYMPAAARHEKQVVAGSGMDWVEGETLYAYVNKHIREPMALIKLAVEFKEMVAALHQKQIAHWDLQNGNIMIANPNCGDPEIKLVDYDSLYVPTLPEHLLEDFPGVEHFQHPQRSRALKEKGDYFSEIVIYLSLLVYAEMPHQWNGEDNADRLFFEDHDFLHPEKSEKFRLLQRSASPEVKNLASVLAQYCHENPLELKPLEELDGDVVTRIFGSAGDLHAAGKHQPMCPNGHVRTDPNDIYCPIDNDVGSFFGKGRLCPNPNCEACIPNHPDLKFCPVCGTNL